MIPDNPIHEATHFSLRIFRLYHENMIMILHKYVIKISITILAVLCSCAMISWAQGDGRPYDTPVGVVRDGTSNIWVVDEALDAVIQVVPVAGDRSIVSDRDMGSGIPFSRPVSSALYSASQTDVVDRNLDAILSGALALMVDGVDTISALKMTLNMTDPMAA